MRISQDAISRVAANIDRLGRRIEKTSEDTFSPLDGGYSPVAGLSEVGTIHQRVLATDPGSARNSLERFREQVAWLGDTLQRELAGLEAQDELNSRGTRIDANREPAGPWLQSVRVCGAGGAAGDQHGETGG